MFLMNRKVIVTFTKKCKNRNKYWKERKNKKGLVSLFYGISTFVGYLIPKSSLQKNMSRTI